MARSRVLAAVCLAAGGAMAEAQEVAPAAELQVGYSYLYDDAIRVDDSGHFPLGWQAALNFALTDSLGLVVDASGHYRSEDDLVDAVDTRFSVHGIHAGLRLTARTSAVQPYLQVLAGATRAALEVGDDGDGVTDFSLQPGLGIVFLVSDAVGIGFGGDYRLLFAEEEKVHEFRAHAGLVFRFGSR
jgi:hypothetical protein